MRFTAKLISYLFHPALVLTYMMVVLLLVNPYLFGVRDITDSAARLQLLIIFMVTAFIPAFASWMMVRLEMIDSMEMKTRQERIGPFLITGILYVWMFLNFKNSSDYPDAFTAFTLGTTLSIFVAFFINLFMKVSLHATGMGGLLTMSALTMLYAGYDTFSLPAALGGGQFATYGLVMAIVVLCGLVGTARLYLQAHTPEELTTGYLVGICTQILGFIFIMG